MFETKIIRGKYRIGDPIRQNVGAMGIDVGTNVSVLYYNHHKQTAFEIVDQATGDTIEVKIIDTEQEAQNLWDKIPAAVRQDIVLAAKQNKKIEAIKLVRAATGTDIKESKNLIDSEFFSKLGVTKSGLIWRDLTPTHNQQVLRKIKDIGK